jgi:uncharacterized protein (TIGR00297 family)
VPLATIESAVLTFSLCLALSSLAYYKQILTKGGTVAAFVTGMIIGIAGDVMWLFLLLFFLLSSFAATKYRFALKEAMGVQEGKKGERGAMNVLANGFAPMAIALLSTFNSGYMPVTWAGLAFLSALAVAGADTLASEIGVLSDRARLITTFKRVKAGTDGGISILGEVCALGASLYTALFGWLTLYFLSSRIGLTVTLPPESLLLLIPAAVGFIGCQIDSVLGATVERRGWIHKRGVNLVATSAGALIAYLLLLWLA